LGAKREMPESLGGMFEAISAEVTSLEQQIEKVRADDEIRIAAGPGITPARGSELAEQERKLDGARQRQLSLLLTSISESSNRLEATTRNLQQSSESQVRIAESHVKVSESQAKTIDDLLRSSHRLEQFAIYLLIMSAINVFIVEYTTGLFNGSYGIVSFVGLLLGIAAMAAIAFRWPYWIRRMPRMNA